MAKKTKTAPIDALVEAAEDVREQHDPQQWIGLDATRMGTYEYIEAPAGNGRDRVVIRDGARYELAAVDLDGCWLYRHVQF